MFAVLELRLFDVNESVIVADGAASAVVNVEPIVGKAGKTLYVTEADAGLATPTSVIVTRVNPNNVSGTTTPDITKRIAGFPLTSTLEDTTEKGDED
jgi:hypothetical protein